MMKHLLKSVLLLCALVAGSGSVWAETQSWDLTKTDYSSSSDDLVTWSSTNVIFTAATNSGTTKVTNYLGGTGANSHTRLYKNNILTFTPLNSATITSITITVTGSTYATPITGGTKTNCSASASGTVVTITPTTGTSACSVELSGATRIGSVDVSYTGGSTAKTATAAFDDKNAFISVGDKYTNSLTTTPDGLAVTYASSDTDIASVNATTGEVTGVDEGIVTITASWAEQTVSETEYSAGSQTYDLYVGHAIEDAVFDFTGYQNYGSGVALSTSTNTYKGVDGYVFTAGNITLTTGGESNKYFAWYDVADDKNELRFYSGSSFTLAAPEGYVITNVAFTGKQNVEKMTVSSGTLTGNNTASTWTGSAQSVTFTRGSANPSYYTITITYMATTVPIVISSATWATFSSTNEVAIPAGVTAYYAQKKDANTVTLKEIEGGYIPANTGVVVSGAANTYAANVTTTGATLAETNLLKPWTTAGTPTEETYYTLAVDGENKPVFKLSTGGVLAAGKAYLVMPTDARELSVDFGGETTGVSEMRNEEGEMRNVYNLNGQRVAQPTRGLYIVNGKKVVVK